jgi:hypothetical protein
VGSFCFPVSFSALLSMSTFSTDASSLLLTVEQVTLTAVVLNLYKLSDLSLWCGILSLLLGVRTGYVFLWSKVSVSCTDIKRQRSGIYFFNILNL